MSGTIKHNPFLDCEVALKRISEFRKKLPAPPTTYFRITVEITKYCSVGCGHCKYNAPLPHHSRKRDNMVLSEKQIAFCVDFTKESEINRIVITGGGEPTHELDGVCALIERADVSEVALYTAGQWGSESRECQEHLERFANSLSASKSEKTLQIRLSVDDFHAERIGVRPIARIVDYLTEKQQKFSKLVPTIRTIQNYDQSVSDLAALLGGAYQKASDFQGSVTTRAGIAIPVDRLNLIPMGRQKRSGQESTVSTSLWSNLEGIQTVQGPGWPVWFRGGLNLGVRPSGKLYLYGGSPEDFGKIPERGFTDILDDLLHDPVNAGVTLLGLPNYFRLLAHCAPALAAKAFQTCEPSILVPNMCTNSRNLLLAKLVAIWAMADKHQSARRVLAQVGPTSQSGEASLDIIKQAYEEGNEK